MVTLRTKDLTAGLKNISPLIKAGEKVLIVRPHNENIVMVSENEYNRFEKALQDLARLREDAARPGEETAPLKKTEKQGRAR